MKAPGLLQTVLTLPHLQRLALSTLVVPDVEVEASSCRLTHLALHYVYLTDKAQEALFSACADTLVDLECEMLNHGRVLDFGSFAPPGGVLSAWAELTSLRRLRYIETDGSHPGHTARLLSLLPQLVDLELAVDELGGDGDGQEPVIFAALSDLRSLRTLYLDERHPRHAADEVLRIIWKGFEAHPPARSLRELRLADDRYPIDLTTATEQWRAEEALSGIEEVLEPERARVTFVARKDGAAFGWRDERV